MILLEIKIAFWVFGHSYPSLGRTPECGFQLSLLSLVVACDDEANKTPPVYPLVIEQSEYIPHINLDIFPSSPHPEKKNLKQGLS